MLPLAAICGAVGLSIAGPLDPPSGAIAPTYKTLAEVEPRTPISAATTPGNASALFRITQPGSYYLTGNIDAPNNVAAIEILAVGVTIDMRGFTILRSASGASTASLVRIADNFRSETTIHDGTIRNSGQHGVELGANARVERLRVIDAALNGISAFSNASVTDCTVIGPGGTGVSVQSNSIVERVTVNTPGGVGIQALDQSRVADCVVYRPAGTGIVAGNQVSVENCKVREGQSWGISASLNTAHQRFIGNTIYQSDAGGIRVYFRAEVLDNKTTCLGNPVPNIFCVEFGNRVQNNSCAGGTDAVKVDAGGFDNLVTNNWSVDATTGNGFANVSTANNVIGPVITAAGTINSSNGFVNFSR
jgi:hypothetical protein